MSSTIDTLRRMANDIARKFEAMGHHDAALAAAIGSRRNSPIRAIPPAWRSAPASR